MNKLPIHRAAAPKIKDKITRGLDSLPQVEIIRPWRGYSVGAIIRPAGVLRQVLLQDKIGRLFVEKPVKVLKKKPAKKAEVVEPTVDLTLKPQVEE